jgi:hypothetical protein
MNEIDKWFKCPKCRCKIKTVYCENCGEEIVIQYISEFKDKQLNVKQEYFCSSRFYNFEYQSVRYFAHLKRAFENPQLTDLCNLILE